MNKKLFLKESDIGLKPAWLLFSFLFIKQINVCVKAKKKKKRSRIFCSFLWLGSASHSSCMKSCLHKCHPSEFLLAVFFGNAIVLIFIHLS